MTNKLYVGNLSYNLTEDELKSAFSQFGEVESCKIIMDYDSGRSKGFGFVEMTGTQEAQNAIGELDGKELGGRALKVNFSKPRENFRR